MGLTRGRALAAARSRLPVRSVEAALGIGIAAHVGLIALLPVFVTVDGPAHLSSAAALRDVVLGTPGVHAAYVEWTPYPVPNMVPSFALAFLLAVLDPGSAEKLFLAMYVVVLPLALLYAVRAIRPENAILSLFALPLTFSFLLHYGFYNFSFGVVAFLVTVGFALRRRAPFNGASIAGLALLLAATYLTHLIPFTAAVVVVFALAVADLKSCDRADTRGRHLLTTIVSLALAVAPSVLLAIPFVASQTAGAAPSASTLAAIPATLAFAWSLVTFDVRETAFALTLAVPVLALMLAALFARRPRPGIEKEDGLLFVLTTLIVVVAAAALGVLPVTLGGSGGFVTQRLALLFVYCVILWLATQRLPRRALAVTAVASVVAAVGLTALRVPSYAHLARASDDLVSVASCIIDGSTVAQANLSRTRPGPLVRTDPLVTEVGRVAALTRGHDLGNIDFIADVFPLRYRAEVDPNLHLAIDRQPIEDVPPAFDPLGYEQRTAGRVDYILVVGRPDAAPEILASASWRALETQLDEGYRLVATSQLGVEVHERWDRPTVVPTGRNAPCSSP